MPTPVFCCGFECGAGHHTLAASASISTSTVRSGARSLRINPTAAITGNSTTITLTASAFWVWRFYVYFSTLPNVDVYISNLESTAGVWFKASDSKIYSNASGTIGTTGVAVTTGQWYRIDAKFNSDGTARYMDVQVDGTACTQASALLSLVSPNSISFGSITSHTSDYYIDDVVATNTLVDYPYGEGKVEHFVPTSDGTHTATTTTIVKGTIAAPTGGGNVAGSTDSFNWVNGVPLLGGATDNTRLINQATAGATLYAEHVMGAAPGISTPTVAPRAVEVIAAVRQAAKTAGQYAIKMNDNGTENVLVDSGSAAGVVTDEYFRKHYALAPTGGAWTVASGAGNFNNFRSRFGYSSDATPDQYLRGIMIEAELTSVVSEIVTKRLSLLGVG